MAEKTESIYEKLLIFHSKVEKIKKDGQNTYFKKPDGSASSYATLPNILGEVKPILAELRLVLTQPIVNGEVCTILSDLDNIQEVKSSIPIPANLNAQQIGSAITYFRRYTLSSLLSLEIDEDDDGNKASGTTAQTQTNQKQGDNRPWLTEQLLKKVVKRITEGDAEVYQKTIDAYRMKKEYKTQLDKLMA